MNDSPPPSGTSPGPPEDTGQTPDISGDRVPAGTGRRSGAAFAAAALALGLALGMTVGGTIGATTAPSAEPSAQPLTDSGPIGPWQHYGNAAAPESTMQLAASHDGGVLLLGDSVAARLRDRLATALHEQGRPMSWDHWNGRPTHGAADMLVSIDAAGLQPPAVVVVSGENDIFEPDLFAVQVERIMRTAGAERDVYWVMPLVQRPETAEADRANSAVLCRRLEEAARHHPNLHLVPWAERMEGETPEMQETLMPDGVHPSPEGVEELTGMIVQAMAGHAA